MGLQPNQHVADTPRGETRSPCSGNRGPAAKESTSLLTRKIGRPPRSSSGSLPASSPELPPPRCPPGQHSPSRLVGEGVAENSAVASTPISNVDPAVLVHRQAVEHGHVGLPL